MREYGKRILIAGIVATIIGVLVFVIGTLSGSEDTYLQEGALRQFVWTMQDVGRNMMWVGVVASIIGLFLMRE